MRMKLTRNFFPFRFLLNLNNEISTTQGLHGMNTSRRGLRQLE